jgi:alpha-ketoglutarate-dependent taurine dioxygenase
MLISDSKVKYSFIKPETESILVITAQTIVNTFDWIKENNTLLENYLLCYGGIILRDFDICSLSEFDKLVKIFCPNLSDYLYCSSPRTKLGGKIYTSTEYPAERTIPLHNEHSYFNSWPQKIFFFSVLVASKGGETPVADSRRVYKKIDNFIKGSFEKKKILYVRNYTPGIDLSWQEVFQTEKRELVEEYCNKNNIEFRWNNEGPELTTKQVCQASTKHPVSQEMVWFNQAHLFHYSALEKSDYTALINELGEDNLPRNAYYGNGDPIEIEVLEHIRKIYNEEKLKFLWQRGDIMILDNVLTAHAREPFIGNRKVAVAMG